MALSQGKSVYLNPGIYNLTGNIAVSNKVDAKIAGNGATINGNDFGIVVSGDNYTTSQDMSISDFTLINGTIHIRDSFSTSISNIIFENTQSAPSLRVTAHGANTTRLTIANSSTAPKASFSKPPLATQQARMPVQKSTAAASTYKTTASASWWSKPPSFLTVNCKTSVSGWGKTAKQTKQAS